VPLLRKDHRSGTHGFHLTGNLLSELFIAEISINSGNVINYNYFCSYDKLYYHMIKNKAGMKTAPKRYDELSKILGKKYIKSNIESPFDFITIASTGLNAHIILNFRNHFGIPRGLTAELLNVSEPTIYRWIKENKKLERNYSVQLLELTDLFLYGSEVFESKNNFFKWLELPNTALGGTEPRKLLEVPGGISKVHDLLGRIEHGVYS
jgi:putative toxin-antitoxin system antitoxin component (TIGR02293 family)